MANYRGSPVLRSLQEANSCNAGSVRRPSELVRQLAYEDVKMCRRINITVKEMRRLEISRSPNFYASLVKLLASKKMFREALTLHQ